MMVSEYAQRIDVPTHSPAPSTKPACWNANGKERKPVPVAAMETFSVAKITAPNEQRVSNKVSNK